MSKRQCGHDNYSGDVAAKKEFCADDSIEEGNKGEWIGCPYYHDIHEKKVKLWNKEHTNSGMTYNDYIHHSIRLDRCYDWLYAKTKREELRKLMTKIDRRF